MMGMSVTTWTVPLARCLCLEVHPLEVRNLLPLVVDSQEQDAV